MARMHVPAGRDVGEAGHAACLVQQPPATCRQKGIQDGTSAFVDDRCILFAYNARQLSCGILCTVP